jgi:hypothetical protein
MDPEALPQRRSRNNLLATLALLVLALAGAGAVMAQSGTQTCSHAGKVYQPGDKITIDGTPMTCDGSSGTWVETEV